MGKRHRRIRARSATGQVAGAATEKPGLNTPIVSMKKGELSMALMLWALGPFGPWGVASGAHLSMACSAAGQGGIGGRLRGLKSKRAVRRPDEKRSLPERE